MSEIAIIGPGAIGGAIAAHLIATGSHSITLCARTTFNGLAVELPDGAILRSRPNVLAAPAWPKAVPPDWVLVATKAYDAEGAAAWLRAIAGPSTRIAIMQNGVEHLDRFRTHVAVEQLVPVMVDLAAERSAPGQVRQRRKGFLRVADNTNGRAFVGLFDGTIVDAATESDFTTTLWSKLTMNAPGAVNALLLQPTRIAHDEAVAGLMRAIMLEVIAVGRAEGAKLDDSLADKVLDGHRAAPPDGINSLHADRLAGRTMEVDARNGAVVRAGRRHGIPTPLNSMAVTLLNALQPSAAHFQSNVTIP